jgi:hypothetical protein
MYREYRTPRPEDNELFSSFAYTRLEGFDYHNGDGTVSRRDPSKVVRENGKYYVWYTKRDTPTPPQGADKSNDTIPSTDWDLAEIWYATSDDGFTWAEQGVAVPRPPKPEVGWRSVSTPDVLKWKDKYYLYYQGFMEASGKKGDHCPVTASMADSPDGPWTPINKVVVENGAPGTWDQFSIHDPYPLVYKGQIYLYYKAAFGDRPEYLVANGLAIADAPLGPFTKHPLNPVLNSSHETAYFPFEEGIATLVTRNGNENNTIQYAPDGVNFSVAAVSSLFPYAAGPYVPDAFLGDGNGRGITWGLAHFTNVERDWSKAYSILSRFDCDLSLDLDDKRLKQTDTYLSSEVYFAKGLGKEHLEQLKTNE